MIGPEFEELEHSLHFEFLVINNEAKYEIMVTSLILAGRLGMTSVKIHSDS